MKETYRVRRNLTEFSQAVWITVPGTSYSWKNHAFRPAPFFRKVFRAGHGLAAKLSVSAGGYYELWLNGEKLSPDVLSPTPTCFDKRLYYRTYSLEGKLRDGDNAVGIILGNSIYNCDAHGVWLQDTITWRDYPRFLLQINDSDGNVLAASDPTWCYYDDGPVRKDSIRSGETYDARKEIGGWCTPEYQAAGWKTPCIGHSPGGSLVPENHPPCRIHAEFQMKEINPCLYDSGQNLAGWCRLRVRGEAGCTVTLRHGERLCEDGFTIFLNPGYLDGDEAETDTYILKGTGEECWSPRFVYHGFRYVHVSCSGKCEILELTACAVGTDFRKRGFLDSDNAVLNGIIRNTGWSYRSNFMGFPTDCPGREKQGWTGDALCAVETGLFLFDSISSYEDWMDSVSDTQRPSGQLAAKAPISSSGYNWGFGPAWDSAFILIPEAILAMTGRTDSIRKHYDAMRRYLDFCSDMCPGHIAAEGFGLGDWLRPHDVKNGTLPTYDRLVCTAFYFRAVRAVARFAKLLGKPDDEKYYSGLAEEIGNAYRKEFFLADGLPPRDCTPLAVTAAFGLSPDPDAVVGALADVLRESELRSMFGIIGSKYVPIALAEYGYADLALKQLLQEQYPGFAWQLKRGATTLWEAWRVLGVQSSNHIMFGSIPAWCFRYPGGFRFSPDSPGTLRLQPVFSSALKNFSSEYEHISSCWNIEGGTCRYRAGIPEGRNIELMLPDGRKEILGAGMHTFEIVCGSSGSGRFTQDVEVHDVTKKGGNKIGGR